MAVSFELLLGNDVFETLYGDEVLVGLMFCGVLHVSAYYIGLVIIYPNNKNKDMCNSVWIYINHKNNVILKSSLELITAGKTVAKNLKQKLIVVVAGYNLEKILKELSKYDVDEILYFDDLKLKDYLCLPYTTVITNIIEKRKPYVFLFVAYVLTLGILNSS